MAVRRTPTPKETKPMPEKKVKAEKQTQPCLCGCGAQAARSFLPGHDARYKSNLVKEAMAGNQTAVATLEARGWGKFLVKAQEIAARKVATQTKKARAEKVSTDVSSLMAEARKVLKQVGRYGVSSGERQIKLEKNPDQLQAIINGVHVDFTDEDRALLAG